MVSNVLGYTGSTIKVCTMMYKSVVHVVLLNGRKVWVVKDTMMTFLEGFHHSITRKFAVITLSKGDSG